MAGAPRQRCQFEIERAFDWVELADACVNRRFFDWPDTAVDGLRAFDLRDRLDG